MTRLRGLLRWRRDLAGPELFLAVAEVFPHEEGQALWWESYERRTPALRRELVADLRRRTRAYPPPDDDR